MGATINIGVKIEVIQADYLEDNGLADETTFTAATLHAIWGSVVGSGGSSSGGSTSATEVIFPTSATRINESGVEDSNGNYVLFGSYPKTIKASSVTVSATADSDGYYTGSDGAKYVKKIRQPRRQQMHIQ